MKKVMISMILAMVLAVFAAGAGWAAEPPMMEKPLTGRTLEACPVHQGMKINKNIYTDYKGQRIYFCCPACPAIFQKDPEKHLQKMREQGMVPEPSPAGK